MTTPRTRVLAAAMVILVAGTSGAVASAAAPPASATGGGAFADATGASPPPERTVAALDGNDTRIVTDGGELVLEPAPNQTIRGETDLEPGTEVSIGLEGHAFARGTTTTVTEEGTFNASFDLYGVSSGVTVGLSVTADLPDGTKRTLVRTTARIECSEDCASRTADSDGHETTLEADTIGLESIVDVTQGRVASINVSFGDADALTVSIGGPSVNYVVNGTIRDQDDDGRATVLFYTDRAGTDAPTLGVVDAGERRVVEANAETSLDSPLAPATYEVTLYRGQTATGELTAVGQILVYESVDSGPTAESANATIVTDDEELVLDPASNQAVRGETDLEPGTDLSVHVQGEQFIKTETTTVTDEGTFSATFNLSDVRDRQRVDVQVYRDDVVLTQTTGRIACSDGCVRATTVATSGVADANTQNAGDSGDRFLTGVGMLALGGVLAVAGIGVLLGVFRN